MTRKKREQKKINAELNLCSKSRIKTLITLRQTNIRVLEMLRDTKIHVYKMPIACMHNESVSFQDYSQQALKIREICFAHLI